jgi:LmbE family N-acetylglucosaminyl deacetylase
MAGRMTLAQRLREIRPRTVILPYWEGRHPDHYRTAEIGYEACFLAGLRKLDQYTEPHLQDHLLDAVRQCDAVVCGRYHTLV